MGSKTKIISAEKVSIISLGVIHNTKTHKILLAHGEHTPNSAEVTWNFPSGKIAHGENTEHALARILGEIGVRAHEEEMIQARIPKENNSLFLVYYLCETDKTAFKKKTRFTSLKWVTAKECSSLITTSTSPKIRAVLTKIGKIKPFVKKKKTAKATKRKAKGKKAKAKRKLARTHSKKKKSVKKKLKRKK